MKSVPRLIRRLPKAKRRAHVDAPWTPADRREAEVCSPKHGAAGFLRFCGHCWIFSKEPPRGWHKMEPWPGQIRLAALLVNGTWILALKGRQVGITSLMRAYAIWRCSYHANFMVVVLNQNLDYAKEFVAVCRSLHQRLPKWAQVRLTNDSRESVEFANGSQIKSLAATPKTARSLTCDLGFLDEAAYMDTLAESLTAINPTLAGAGDAPHGQYVVLSSSSGPQHEFHTLWEATYGEAGELIGPDGKGPSGFTPVFFHWSERPGRTAEWKAARVRELSVFGPNKAKQEFPENPQEAFEFAEGRVFPNFTRERHTGRIEIPPYAQRGRCVDWGETRSAYVVLWYAYVPGPLGLLIDPDCKKTIREFLGYRFDADGWPVKENDHAPDALRYAVTRWRLKGLVYVYREIHETDRKERGLAPSQEAAEIHRRSGWIAVPGPEGPVWRPGPQAEVYEFPCVVDRAAQAVIREFQLAGIPCAGSPVLKGPKDKQAGGNAAPVRSEVLQGIDLVQELVNGPDLDQYYTVRRDSPAHRIMAGMNRKPGKVTDGELAETARRLLGV